MGDPLDCIPLSLHPCLALVGSIEGSSRQQELRNQGYPSILGTWPVSPVGVLFRLLRHKSVGSRLLNALSEISLSPPL